MFSDTLSILEFNKETLKSELVTQDVLILTGDQDHFIPLKLHQLQVDALTRVNSITERIFTEADQSQNHCQVGNIGLALKVMSDWLEEVSVKRRKYKLDETSVANISPQSLAS